MCVHPCIQLEKASWRTLLALPQGQADPLSPFLYENFVNPNIRGASLRSLYTKKEDLCMEEDEQEDHQPI